jgi:hypothetical protein
MAQVELDEVLDIMKNYRIEHCTKHNDKIIRIFSDGKEVVCSLISDGSGDLPIMVTTLSFLKKKYGVGTTTESIKYLEIELASA